MEMILCVSDYKMVAIQILVLLVVVHISFTNAAGIVPTVSTSSEDFRAMTRRVASLESRQSSTEIDVRQLNRYSESLGQIIVRHLKVESKLDDVRDEILDINRERNSGMLELRNQMEQIKQDHDNSVLELRNELEEIKLNRDSAVIELRKELNEIKRDCRCTVLEQNNQTEEMNEDRDSAMIELQDRMQVLKRDVDVISSKMQELQNTSNLRQESDARYIQEVAKGVNEIKTNVSDITTNFQIQITETKHDVDSLKRITLNIYNSIGKIIGSLFNGTGNMARNSTNTSERPPTNAPTTPQTTKRPLISTFGTSTNTPAREPTNEPTTPRTTQGPVILRFGTTGRDYLITNGCADKKAKLIVAAADSGKMVLCQGSICQNLTVNKGENSFRLSSPVQVPRSQAISENKTVTVTSNVDVSVLYQGHMNKLNEAHTYLALPLKLLSTHYVTVTFRPRSSYYYYCYVQVAALNDETRISFNISMRNGSNNALSYKNRIYNNGDMLQVDLNRHQIFKIASETDFTGTYVQSSKPAAVFSGCYGAEIRSFSDSDFFIQMIPPTKCLQTKFIIPPFITRLGFIVRVVAAYSNTRIRLNQQSTDLSAIGSFFEYDASTPNTNVPVAVSSNKPVLTVLFAKTGFGRDNRTRYHGGGGNMIIIPAVSQYMSSYLFVVPETKRFQTYVNDSYVAIISPRPTTPTLLINGLHLLTTLTTNINEKHTVTFQSVTYDVISFKIDPGLYTISSYTAEKFGIIYYGFKYANGWGNPVYLNC